MNVIINLKSFPSIDRIVCWLCTVFFYCLTFLCGFAVCRAKKKWYYLWKNRIYLIRSPAQHDMFHRSGMNGWMDILEHFFAREPMKAKEYDLCVDSLISHFCLLLFSVLLLLKVWHIHYRFAILIFIVVWAHIWTTVLLRWGNYERILYLIDIY